MDGYIEPSINAAVSLCLLTSAISCTELIRRRAYAETCFVFICSSVVINKHEQMVSVTFTRPRALTIKGAQRFEKENLCSICKRYDS